MIIEEGGKMMENSEGVTFDFFYVFIYWLRIAQTFAQTFRSGGMRNGQISALAEIIRCLG